MSDKQTNDKSDKDQNQNTQEPSLFEEKTAGGGKWKTRLFFIAFFVIAGLVFWPKASIKGEGLVQAERFARIGLTSSGILKELIHKKGDTVQKGELLVRFENPELSRKFEERKLTLEILNHDKTRLEKQVEFLAKDKDRKNILFENGVIGRLQFDKASLDYVQAEEELSMRKKEIESVEGEVKFLKERVESLELRAPFSGMLLTDPGITIGNLLKEGDFVLEFADPNSFFLEILISEKEIERVAAGSAAKARFRAFSWKTYSGEIADVGPRTTEEVEKVFNVKHVIPCKVKLDEFPANAKYGMRAWITVSGKRRTNLKPAASSIQKPTSEALGRFINPKALETANQKKENSNDNPSKS